MTLETAVGEGRSVAVVGVGEEALGGAFLGFLLGFGSLLSLGSGFLSLGILLSLLGFFADPEVLLGGIDDLGEFLGLFGLAGAAQAAHLAGHFLVVVLGHLGGIGELDGLGSGLGLGGLLCFLSLGSGFLYLGGLSLGGLLSLGGGLGDSLSGFCVSGLGCGCGGHSGFFHIFWVFKVIVN